MDIWMFEYLGSSGIYFDIYCRFDPNDPVDVKIKTNIIDKE